MMRQVGARDEGQDGGWESKSAGKTAVGEGGDENGRWGALVKGRGSKGGEVRAAASCCPARWEGQKNQLTYESRGRALARCVRARAPPWSLSWLPRCLLLPRSAPSS